MKKFTNAYQHKFTDFFMVTEKKNLNKTHTNTMDIIVPAKDHQTYLEKINHNKTASKQTNNSISFSAIKRIKESSITRLKESINIKDTVSELIPLKGNKACCPFHDEKTASFSVNPGKNIFKCFGCGKGGNSIDFVMEHLKLNFIEAVEYLASKNNFDLEYEENFSPENNSSQKEQITEQREVVEFAQSLYERELNDLNRGSKHREYLHNRDLTKDAINEWGLGAATESRLITPKIINAGKLNAAVDVGISCTNDGKNYDFLYDRITIPIHDEKGKLVGIAGRTIEDKKPKYLNPKESELYKKSQVLFGLYQAINAKAFASKFAFMVEGYFDVISQHEAGCLNTVAACGTSISDNQIKLLKRYVQEIIIFFDSDTAGIEKSKKLIDQLLFHGLKVEIIELPEGMDPDEHIREFKKNNPSDTYQEHLLSLKQDAVIWKAGKLFNNESDPDALALGVDIMVQTLLNISNETKRKVYQDQICKKWKTCSTIKVELKNSIAKKQQERIQKQEKARIEGKGLNNQAMGLPDDFTGEASRVLKYGIYEYKGLYYSKEKDRPISNFTMQILYHISSTRDVAYKVIKAVNEYGIEIVFQINTDEWVSVGGFKKVLARHGDFVFKGNESDLSRLQQYLQESELNSQIIDTLGYSKRGNFWAFANGIIPIDKINSHTFLKADKYGIVSHNGKNYCLPALSKMYEDKDELFITEKKFIYVEPENKISFNEWAVLFNNAYGKKGMVAIVWLLASFFRDVIMKIQGSFPILNLFGQKGSGKGTIINSLLRLFGDPQEPIMLGGESTAKGFMRKFAQFSNAVVWADEYKNSYTKIIENLKNIFDGVGYVTAQKTQDFQTNISPVKSSLILSGQEMPTAEPALFSRVIELQFKPGKFSDTQKENYQLLQDIEKDGLSYLTTDILKHRQLFIDRYRLEYRAIDDKLTKEIDNKEIDERFIKNISTLATTYSLLKDSIDFPFSYIELTNFLKENMMEQFKILAGSDDLGRWWQTVEILANNGTILEGRDYLFEAGDYFLIRLRTVHPLYLIELRKQGAVGLDFSTLTNYLKDDGSYKSHPKKSFPKAKVQAWCDRFKYSLLNIDLFKETEETPNQRKISLNKLYIEGKITAEEFIIGDKEIDNELQQSDLPF